jgi:hypothetical protein
MLLSVATVCGAVGLSAPAWGSPRSELALTVSPSTGLRRGQLVQVTGRNWPPNDVVSLYTVYVAGGLDPHYGPATQVTTASDGSFSQPVEVRRFPGGSDYDCARLAPGEFCVILASSAGGFTFADIAFAPK